MEPNVIHAKAIELCRLVLRMTTQAEAGHPSSAISLAHIIATLMYTEMRYDPKNPWHRSADRLILSEGHAVPIVYAAYADLKGVVGEPSNARTLDLDDIDQLRELGSVLDGHPNPAEGFPFFDAATGSLGMGLSVACGLALAARLDGIDKNLYCIIGDGESREGQIWEALDFAVDHRLGNVCAIFNCNGQGQAGQVSRQQSPQVLQDKLTAYGWQVQTIDGHEPNQILQALQSFRESDKPFAIVAKTVKGWGVQPLQKGNFHGKPVPQEKLSEALSSLDDFSVTTDTKVAESEPSIPATLATVEEAKTIHLPPFAVGLEQAGMGGALETKMLATRRAYGAALSALGELDDRVVALDGDVSNSTFADVFAQRHADRFFEGKIAEQNLLSAAVGLAAGGKIPFVSSFAKFIARAYDQVELAIISRANINIVGSHSGLGPASDGPSQMGLADVAFFRTFTEVDDGRGRPSCVLLQPADAIAAYKMTALMARTPNPCYLRTHRPDVPFLYPFDEEFEIGGSKVLRKGDAVTLVASGYMVQEAMPACEELAKNGVECNLIDAYCLPMNIGPILEAANRSKNTIVTIEDNYGGGFGTAIAEAAAQYARLHVRQLIVKRIPKSARKHQTLMARHNLASPQICNQVMEIVRSVASR